MAHDEQRLSLSIAACRKLCNYPLEYRPPTSPEVAAAERALGIRFPSSYLEFLRRTADCRVECWGLLRIYPDAGPPGEPDDIVYTNKFNQSGGLPRTLVAFFAVGNGDFYCFNTEVCTTGDEWQIMNWRHDAEPDEPPDSMNDSFPDWLAEEIRDRS